VNISVLVGRFPPEDVGGAERQADRLAAALAARGHRVTVYTRRWPGRAAREERDGFTIVRTPIAFAGPARSVFDLCATVLAIRRQRPRPDVVLAYQTFISGWKAAWIDVLFDIPAATWIRGENEYRFDRNPWLFGPSLFAWRQARRVLVQSAAHRERLLAQVALRDSLRSQRLAQRIDIIGNGVDLPATVSPGGSDWLFVGRLISHKGVNDLLTAIAGMPAAARRPLWIVGDGPERAALEQQARTLGVDARFEGMRARDELAGYFARARAVILPSTEGEGLPNAILEAMAQGVPVVVTSLPGLAELTGAGGRVVPIGDPAAIAHALIEFNDDTTRARAARAARERAQEFSWSAITDRLEGVLTEIAHRAPRVWLVSPNPTSRGGVAAVARQIAVSPLTRTYRISLIATHVPGSLLARIWQATVGIGALAGSLVVRKPDLVHVKIASGGSFVRKVIVGVLCRIRGVPTLVHVHGGGFDQFVTRAPAPVRALARWLMESTPQVLALSDRWAGRLRALFPRARIDVLYNPVEAGQYAGIARERLALPAAPPVRPMALFLGDLVERKGVYDLVAAWADVSRACPGARLVLAGVGEHEKLIAACWEAGVGDVVELPGWLGLDEKRRLLREATMFVLPSYIEGVPISLLEAMAAALPSIVTPVGGVLDAVTDGREALVVPAGDRAQLAAAITRVFQTPALARALGEAGLASVGKYDLAAFAGRLDAIYRRILESRGAVQPVAVERIAAGKFAE
jgi:glycosyltransferase involved in cell wall biosynthesis